MRTVLGLLGMVIFLSCAGLILGGWRNPSSKFLLGFVQTRDVRAKDPKRTAAAACWMILGFAAGSVGVLVSYDPGDNLRTMSPQNAAGYMCAAVALVCLALAAYVRFGDAPQALRPAAMRDPG